MLVHACYDFMICLTVRGVLYYILNRRRPRPVQYTHLSLAGWTLSSQRRKGISEGSKCSTVYDAILECADRVVSDFNVDMFQKVGLVFEKGNERQYLCILAVLVFVWKGGVSSNVVYGVAL